MDMNKIITLILITILLNSCVDQNKKLNNLKQIFPNCKEAADKLGIYESGINSCVNGKQKSSKGFIWKRKTVNNFI